MNEKITKQQAQSYRDENKWLLTARISSRSKRD